MGDVGRYVLFVCLEKVFGFRRGIGGGIIDFFENLKFVLEKCIRVKFVCNFRDLEICG